MPLQKRDAARALNALWQLREKLNDEEGDGTSLQEDDFLLSKAISILHCYITDVIPSIHPAVRLQAETNVQFTISSEAFVQSVQINCKTTRDPGLSLVGYTSKNGKIYYCVGHVEAGTVLDRASVFKRGDIILDINNRPLSRVSLEKAR